MRSLLEVRLQEVSVRAVHICCLIEDIIAFFSSGIFSGMKVFTELNCVASRHVWHMREIFQFYAIGFFINGILNVIPILFSLSVKALILDHLEH